MNKPKKCAAIPFFRQLMALVSLFITLSTYPQQDQLAINASFSIKGSLSLDADQPTFGGRSPVSFLKDSAGQQFVLKINCNSEASIHEALGAYIGSSVDIPINKVRIIPPHTNFIGKPNNDRIGTLHTRAPGTAVSNINWMANKCNIYNGLAQRINLDCCTMNDDLCDIVALDIFVDNFDRHNGNLFYDEPNGRFHAIDMDYIFGKAFIDCSYQSKSIIDSPIDHINNLFSEPTANVSERFLLELSQSKTSLSQQEVVALKRILSTIDILIYNYPPKKIYDVWMNIAQEAHYAYPEEKKNYIIVTLLYNAYKIENFRKQLTHIIHQQERL